MAVKPVPEGHHTVTPYLAVDDAAAAIEFYKQAFGATEPDRRLRMPDLPGCGRPDPCFARTGPQQRR